MSPEYEHLQINQIIQNRFTHYIYVVNRFWYDLLVEDWKQTLDPRDSLDWHEIQISHHYLQSVSWILTEFCYNRSPQGPYTGTCTILQETINGFLCPLIVFRKM